VPQSASRLWTCIGLGIAFASMPLFVALFNALDVPWNATSVVLRELVLFGFAGALLLVVRRGEKLGWSSVGLQRPALAGTALWVLITLVLAILAIALAFVPINLFDWPIGKQGRHSFDVLPVWVVILVITRAGFIEELFYRGYLIERLEALTGNRMLAAGLPLAVFAACHYGQGWAGILIALLTGTVLTWVYIRKRNLWITIITHFLGDFIPNIILPLFSGGQS
jgi:membrane protease YdiL (CAAX protease family)